MLRVLLLGNSGQLGWELERTLASRFNLVPLDFPEIDLSDERSIKKAIATRGQFQVIINAAAYTDVDRAEREKELVMSINAYGPAVLAEIARKMGAVFFHYSTDYVFNGNKGSPYFETDEPNPINLYGKSKLEGEKAVVKSGCSFLIFRTAWLYSLRRDSFVNKVLRWAQEVQEIKIVVDQVSNPTWARSLAEANSRLLCECKSDALAILHNNNGIFHVAGTGFVSRFEWAKAILEFSSRRNNKPKKIEVFPSVTSEFNTLACRPLFTALDCTKFRNAFGFNLVHWKDALQLAFESD